MRVYVAHSTSKDYQNDIYKPLKSAAFFSQFEFVLPHERSTALHNTRKDYKNFDLVIAECSEPSTGVGIELGWLFDDGKPIYCFYKKGTKPSKAIQPIANRIIEYENSLDFINKIEEILAPTSV